MKATEAARESEGVCRQVETKRVVVVVVVIVADGDGDGDGDGGWTDGGVPDSPRPIFSLSLAPNSVLLPV